MSGEELQTDEASLPEKTFSDPRALGLIVFQKFHSELPELGEEPGDRAMARLLLEAINLLPDFEARPGDKPHILLLQRLNMPHAKEIPLNIQAHIDALKTIWRDYLDSVERENGQNLD